MINYLASLGATDGVAVTTDMIEPIVDVITNNIAVVMPIGITVFGLMVGLSLVPRVIRMFLHG